MKPAYHQQIKQQLTALLWRLLDTRRPHLLPAQASAGVACQGCRLASVTGTPHNGCVLPPQASYAAVRGQMPPQPRPSGSRLSEQQKTPRLRAPGQLSRRDLLGMCIAGGSLALGASAGVLGFMGIARDLGVKQQPLAGVPKKGAIGLTSQARNSARTFANPRDGQQSLLIHLPDGSFVAYERACTHRGVYVDYDPGTRRLVCPAHGAIFDPAQAGQVLQGPATTPLPAVPLQVQADGTITVG